MRRDTINDMIDGVLGGGSPKPQNDTWVSPEIEEAKLKALKYYEAISHNYNNHWIKKEWDTARLGSTSDPEIQEVLDAIEALGLPLQVHLGKGYGYYYADIDKVEDMEGRLYKISNPQLGHHLQFSIDHDGFFDFERKRHKTYGRVSGDLYWVETERQGSYYNSKTFLTKQLAPLFLEYIGYNSIYGTAMVAANTEIRSAPATIEDDWRWLPKYVGLDEALNPIFLPSLQYFYMLLGYTMNPNEILACEKGEMHSLQAKSVNLLSKAARRRTKKWLGQEGYDELTKYDESNLREWRKITRQREALLDREELEQRKAYVLADLIERQKAYDELGF